MNDKQPLYSIRYTIPKEAITEFVNSLYEMQQTYIEEAVEASGYKDAKRELARIMEMK